MSSGRIVVQTAAHTHDLVDLATTKLELDITGTSEDVNLARWITQASEQVRSITGGRTLALEEVLETIAGMGDRYILLSRRPIVAISSVASNGNTIVDHVVEDAEAGLVYREAAWDWSTAGAGFIEREPVPGQEIPKFGFTYTGGYVLPGYVGQARIGGTGNYVDADVNVPADLQGVVYDLVRLRRDRKGRDLSVESERIGDWQAKYAKGVPQGVLDALVPYMGGVVQG